MARLVGEPADILPVTPGPRSRIPLWSLALTISVLASGCHQIHLNWAMEEVNRCYVELFFDIETRGYDQIRTSAGELMNALADPAVTDYSEEPEYQDLLTDSSEAAGLIIEEIGEEDRELLIALRSRISQTCQGCHEVYRKKASTSR